LEKEDEQFSWIALFGTIDVVPSSAQEPQTITLHRHCDSTRRRYQAMHHSIASALGVDWIVVRHGCSI
jgi:hypothetical protein